MKDAGANASKVQEFILHQVKKGVTKESAPRARYDHLKWWAVQMGAPINLPDWIRPAKKMTVGGVCESQAVAADPEIHLQMEQTLLSGRAEVSCVGPLLGALLIAYSVLRFRHAQRSVLIKLSKVTLSGACARG